MSIQGIGPSFNMRPSFESTYIKPYFTGPVEPLKPVGQLMAFDNTPIDPPFTEPRDGAANLLTRMGVDVAAGYSLAIAEQKAPSGRVNLLA